MNEKFFVPYNTAQKLKANGYNEECDRFYDNSGTLTTEPKGSKIAAPTYHEVIDWLELSNIRISIFVEHLFGTRFFENKCKLNVLGTEFCTMGYNTREEALNAAILKALELI